MPIPPCIFSTQENFSSFFMEFPPTSKIISSNLRNYSPFFSEIHPLFYDFIHIFISPPGKYTRNALFYWSLRILIYQLLNKLMI